MLKLAGLTGIIAVALISVWSVRWELRKEQVAGHQLYLKYCASCHGEKLQGQPDWQMPKADGRLPAPPHDATGHTWHHSDAELFRITKYGMSSVIAGHQSDMPGFNSILTDQQIGLILEFIKSTWPQRERDYQHARNPSSP